MKFNTIIYITILFILSASCRKGDKDEKTVEKQVEKTANAENMIELNAAQVKAAGIQTGTIQMRQLSGMIKASGVLDVPPQNLVSVTTTLGGFLQSTELLQGVRVRKGQLIAALKSNEYIQLQQEYLENRSKLELVQAEYKRQQQLATENANAQKTLQQAKAEYDGTAARVNGLKARLQMAGASMAVLDKGEITSQINIVSPINGYVTQVNVSLGAFISPGTEMFRIVDTEHLHAELRIYERDLPKIKIGNTVYFNLAHESTPRKAHVFLVGREIEPDRTIRIHCHLDKEDTDLLPGMYITGTIETQSGNLPALPDEALVSHEGKKYIFISKGTRKEGGEEMTDYEMLEVATGLAEFGYTEVQLPAGVDMQNLKIVVKGAYTLLSKKFNGEEDGH